MTSLPLLGDSSLKTENPVRVMALHALLYCPRLFYLEEVEGIRVADDRVFAGRELHASLEAEQGDTWESLELESPTLGLVGKLDVLKRRDGQWIPYEHKRGRCMKPARRGRSSKPKSASTDEPSHGTGVEDDADAGASGAAAAPVETGLDAGDDAPQAWPTDRVQVAAYAMMLEEALGRPFPEGRVRYHADNVTVRVKVDDGLRGEVIATIREARRLRETIDRPPITENENLCKRCSLAPVCLPEEVRQARDPEHASLRLFPEDDARVTLHVVTDGSSVGRSADRLVVRPREGAESKHAAKEVGTVVLHGFSQISTQAIRLCTEQDIAVHWVTAGGRHVASLSPTVGQVQRRIRQFQALCDPQVRIRLARQLVIAKVASQHRYLLRATREDPDLRDQASDRLRRISQTLHTIAHAPDADILRGREGEAAHLYWSTFNLLLRDDVPEPLRYVGRSRRPPADRLSALLNFGYALLQTAVMRSILATGLDPSFGFYHTPRSDAHPLVLDLMELFRVMLWDIVVVGSINRRQWDPDADFVATRTHVWLSDQGRRKAIDLFENRLQESWRHPVVDYSLSYARTIELEARLLEKEWTGEPGLFARLRLR